ncbi:hypothetical protein GCM10010219_11440 [Streptomyces netropsis]|nr:hypothetical protein GCM10010219_11440 [Streptomyces netropsis]
MGLVLSVVLRVLRPGVRASDAASTVVMKAILAPPPSGIRPYQHVPTQHARGHDVPPPIVR